MDSEVVEYRESVMLIVKALRACGNRCVICGCDRMLRSNTEVWRRGPYLVAVCVGCRPFSIEGLERD